MYVKVKRLYFKQIWSISVGPFLSKLSMYQAAQIMSKKKKNGDTCFFLSSDDVLILKLMQHIPKMFKFNLRLGILWNALAIKEVEQVMQSCLVIKVAWTFLKGLDRYEHEFPPGCCFIRRRLWWRNNISLALSGITNVAVR